MQIMQIIVEKLTVSVVLFVSYMALRLNGKVVGFDSHKTNTDEHIG